MLHACKEWGGRQAGIIIIIISIIDTPLDVVESGRETWKWKRFLLSAEQERTVACCCANIAFALCGERKGERTEREP